MLGDFQDRGVQGEKLRTLQATLECSEQEGGEVLLQVADGMMAQRRQLRADFAASFDKFLHPRKKHTLATLCAGKLCVGKGGNKR